MLRFCLGDLELTYSLRNGEPAAIVAGFSEPVSNHDAALMLQLAARIRVVIDAVPAWSAARMVIWRTRRASAATAAGRCEAASDGVKPARV